MLMRWLADAGAGFDCASGTELQKAASLFKTKQEFQAASIFANPCKPHRDLQLAADLESGPTVVDSVEELEKLHDLKWKQGALIRIAVDDQGSKMPFSKKFGAAITDIQKIKDAAFSLKQDIRGISFHVGSGCLEPLQYSKAIQLSLLNLQGLPNATIVDIGGGFEANPKLFHQATHYIQESIKSVPPTLKIDWIAEPGRFMATEFQDLFVPVIGKKPAGDGNGWRYTLDESLYGQFSCIPFDRYTPKWVRIRMKTREAARKRTKGTLFGRTCDSVDMIAQSDSMEELEVGDWLWFPHMGAYTSVTATEFNGFPKPKIHYTDESLPYTIYMSAEAWPEAIKTVSHVLVPKA
jgi:ornithine decarboxylase